MEWSGEISMEPSTRGVFRTTCLVPGVAGAAPYVAVILLAAAACEPSPIVQRYTPAELADCADCSIRLELIAELGSENDTIWATAFSSALRTADGQFIVTATDHPGVQLIYSPSGKLVDTFGKEGQGPGEYQAWTTPYLGPADTVSIVDMFMSRRTIIDASGSRVREHRLPVRFRRATFIGNRMIVQADVPTADKIGYPLHEIDSSNGEILYSFAEVEAYQEPALDGYRVIAPAGDSGLWVAPPNELAFDYYDSDLDKVRTMRVEADWFLPHRNPPAMSYDMRPDPRTLAAWQSDDGLLWVLVIVADQDWEPRDPPVIERAPSVEDSRVSSDWVLAVIDPATGEQLAAVQFDSVLMKGYGDDLIYMFVERPAGGASFAAYKPTYSKR